MDREQRPHNRTTTSSELFICFTSRNASSSKSILSCEPPQSSLSSSLSRRLCSVKGGHASPKKGGASDNPEPSSPKVTCIGQVRVKTKKQGKKLRSRSKRRGEVSFRRVEHGSAEGTGQISRSFSRRHFNQQRSQRWVHLPVTICEALRSFGAELNCLLPCRSSCMTATREREKPAGSGGGTRTSCGAVFVRWLQDGDGKGREIELVVAEDPPESCRSRRRHVFEDINIEADGFEEKKSNVCVPPKNALLLMRCRSDPVKMAALSNHLTHKDNGHEEMPTTVQLQTEHSKNVEEDEPGGTEHNAKDWVNRESHQKQYAEPGSETDLNLTVHELKLENQEIELVTSDPANFSNAIVDTTESESESEAEDYSEEEESETEAQVLAEMAVTEELREEEETTTRVRSEPDEAGLKSTEEGGESQQLPDCLMLMMYEPKLSMEVSKETWVCTTDFIRWLPERPPVKTDIQDEPKKRIAHPQPPRSSCSFPEPEPEPASCEPLALTRCKSEPRKSAAKLEGTRTMRSAFNEVLRCA